MLRLEKFKVANTIRRIREGGEITTAELTRLEKVARELRLMRDFTAGNGTETSGEARMLLRVVERAIEAVMVPCGGEAHSNPHIDHCGCCAPRWGRKPGPRVRRPEDKPRRPGRMPGGSGEFTLALEAWLTAVNKMRAEADFEPVEAMPGGKRYIRIAEMRDGRPSSAYAFIDTTNGDVLKPAGWKGPAKHARGNIYRREAGLGVSRFGANYLR